MELTYEEFINNILETRGRFACGEEYHERHHIMPRCMGGEDEEENLIDLFAREHFEVHKLLAQENPDNNKLVYAWWMLAHIDGREITAEEYEEAKIAFNKIHRRVMTGRIVSNETRQKQSAARKHENNARATPIIRLSDGVIYEYIGRAAKENNMHRTTMTRRCQTHNGFMYYDEYQILKENNMSLLLDYINNSNYDNSNGVKGSKHPNARGVIQLTTNDVFVQQWECISQASVQLRIDYTGIVKCVNGDQKSAGGFKWKYKTDWEERQSAENIDGKN